MIELKFVDADKEKPTHGSIVVVDYGNFCEKGFYSDEGEWEVVDLDVDSFLLYNQNAAVERWAYSDNIDVDVDRLNDKKEIKRLRDDNAGLQQLVYEYQEKESTLEFDSLSKDLERYSVQSRIKRAKK
jgi:hypothetical protein